MRRTVAIAALAALAVTSAGCNIMGPLLYILAPPQTTPAEYTLPKKGKIALFVEFARPEQENTVFVNEFETRLGEIFKERKVLDEPLVPMREVYRLRRAHPDFKDWGLQRIARELDADLMIYVRVAELRLKTTRGVQILEPHVEVYMRVISTSEPSASARVWPGSDETDGRKIVQARQVREATSAMTYDDEAGKLARDLATRCAMPFYEVDKEERVPWEK